jgi:hypothetical protein
VTQTAAEQRQRVAHGETVGINVQMKNAPDGGCYELQRILLLLNQLRPKFVDLGFSHAPSESEGEKLMWLQANRGILPHSDLKPENAEQRFHPIKSRVSTFQFVTPSGWGEKISIADFLPPHPGLEFIGTTHPRFHRGLLSYATPWLKMATK